MKGGKFLLGFTGLFFCFLAGIWMSYIFFTVQHTHSSTPIGDNPAPVIQLANMPVQDQIANSRINAITRAVKTVSPAVVGINVTEVRRYVRRSPFADDPFFRHFFPDLPLEQRVKRLGSGVIISKDGHVLTNQHVVEDASEVIVTLVGGQEYVAEIIGQDFKTDVAVLKIKGNNLPYARMGDSDDTIIGEWAIALGNPLGLFDISSKPTVTVGVISATDQDFGKLANDRVYEDMIQTDAAINSGNSGGPLVNANGEVIGINTWIISGSDTRSANIGLGFAIPVNRVKRILNDLIKHGTVDRNFWTGITCSELTPLIARYLGIDKTNGAIISEIAPNSPAEKAGLEVGDVIVELDGKPVKELLDINRIIDELDLRSGDYATFRVYHDRKYVEKRVKLEAYPKSRGYR